MRPPKAHAGSSSSRPLKPTPPQSNHGAPIRRAARITVKAQNAVTRNRDAPISDTPRHIATVDARAQIAALASKLVMVPMSVMMPVKHRRCARFLALPGQSNRPVVATKRENGLRVFYRTTSPDPARFVAAEDTVFCPILWITSQN